MGDTKTTDHINDVMNKDVAEKEGIPSAKRAEGILAVNSLTAYIEADAFIGNPYSLLGRVIEIRKVNGKCPTNLTDPNIIPEFSLFPIPNVRIDEDSKIKKPIKRNSIMVDQKLCTKVGFLNFLATELDAQSTFSIMVFDQAIGLVDINLPSWAVGLRKWKAENASLMNDPDICYLFVVIGMVQKNIIRKKFRKFSVGAKGGAFGVNVGGNLYTSTEDYSLDIRFGLTPAILKRPAVAKTHLTTANITKTLMDKPNDKELEIFGSINSINTVIGSSMGFTGLGNLL